MNDDDHSPPHDYDAERAVLGAMLLSKDAIGDVVQVMVPGEHYKIAHEFIHDVILDLYGRGEPVDVVTVIAALTRTKQIGKVGGPLYVHSLAEDVPVVGSAGYYARIVRDMAVRRRMIDAGTSIRSMAYADADVDALADRAQSTAAGIIADRMRSDYVTIGSAFADTIDHIESIELLEGDDTPGIPTGLIDLDALTGGLRPGQMVVVAARPAMGKSTLAIDFARSASIRHGLCSCVFSLEMTRQELTTRVIAAEAKVSLSNLLTGATLSDFEWGKIAGATQRIVSAPLFIDDSPNMTMTEIRAKARRLKIEHDLRLIVIDYLQLMTSGQRVENRQTEVSEFSRQIKLLAKELEVPVVALSQLNRGPEQRTNKRPLMSDLRESGSIEQDADLVMLLHRDDVYEKESSRPGEADIIIAKHRNGPTRDLTVAFQGHYSRFVDMAPGG